MEVVAASGALATEHSIEGPRTSNQSRACDCYPFFELLLRWTVDSANIGMHAVVPASSIHIAYHTAADMAQSHPIVVAQRKMQNHASSRTEHWSLVVLRSINDALVLEIIGNSDTFAYVPTNIRNFARLRDLRGGCLVGSIAADRLDWLQERLRAIPVVRYDPSFDCQTWVFDVLRLLKDDGVVTEDISERHIRAELKLEEERWEESEDTIEERIFPPQ